MSRKTRKLIWSAPLVAVLAVAGALAMFVMLAPDNAQADGAPGPVTGLNATTDKSYTEIELSWTAPATGTVTGYRIDMASATNPHVWFAHVADTESTDTTYNDMGLSAGQARRYRVFALNGDHTGPASIRNESVVGSTKSAVTPGAVLNVRAVAAGSNQINLSWDPPSNLGADKLARYCIVAFDSDGTTVIGDTEAGAADVINATKCGELNLKADDLPELNDADGDTAPYLHVIVDGGATTYQHKAKDLEDDSELDAEDEWHYIVFAATRGHDVLAATTYAASDFSSAASNTAKATTAKASAGDPVQMPGSLIASPGASTVDLYWAWPAGYESENFYWEVSTKSNFPTGDDTMAAAVIESAASASATTAQVADNTQSGDSGRVYYRVRAGTATDTRNVWSNSASVPLPLRDITDETHRPAIDNTNGLTATPDTANPRNQINLAWTDEETDRPDPTGHVLHYRKNVDNAPWRELEYSPYQCCSFEHLGLDASTSYQYRIFPYYDSADKGRIYGAPDHAVGLTANPVAPDPVRGLEVVSAGRDALKLTWNAVTVDGGAPIVGYRVDVAADDIDNDATLGASPGWEPVEDVADGSIYHVAADETREYTYKDATANSNAGLTAGNVRWFQVFAVNAANDGGNTDALPPTDTGPSELEQAQADAVPGEVASTVLAPNAPKSLTAETARNSSGMLQTDRGVQLHWLTPDDHDEPENLVTSYVIERREKVGDADWTDWDDVGTILITASNPGRTHFTDGDKPAANEQREYRVGAKNGKGTTLSNVAEYPLDPDHTHPPASMDEMAPSMVEAMVGTGDTVELTWTPGENATIHWVGGYRVGDDNQPDLDNHFWMMADSDSGHTLDMSDKAAGTYVFQVTAGMYDSATDSTSWSTWEISDDYEHSP